MKINPQNLTFKGYDAAPLKSIYLEETEPAFHEEIEKVCDKEKIEARKVISYFKWAQDNKIIIEKKGKPTLIADMDISRNTFPQMECVYKIQGRKSRNFIRGGNAFIGKLPSGEKYLMAGKEELKKHDITSVAKEYGVNVENIYPISSPNFHLDLFIRPIGYPYVLVNDPELAEKKLEEMNDNSIDFRKIKNNFQLYEETRASKYSSCDTVCRELEEKGFIPIRIAGVFGSYVNFMNAIVNKHSDGTISYITNSSECKDPYYTKLQKDFEKELRQKANIDKIYFIKGGSFKNSTTNYMMDTLDYGHGGIHCMTMEEPDFSVWA